MASIHGWGIFNGSGELLDTEDYLEIYITETVALERVAEIEEIEGESLYVKELEIWLV